MLVVKNPPANAGDIRDVALIPGLGRSSGGGHGNALQYSCLENPQWTEEPGRLQPIRLHRVEQNWSNLAFTHEYSITGFKKDIFRYIYISRKDLSDFENSRTLSYSERKMDRYHCKYTEYCEITHSIMMWVNEWVNTTVF